MFRDRHTKTADSTLHEFSLPPEQSWGIMLRIIGCSHFRPKKNSCQVTKIGLVIYPLKNNCMLNWVESIQAVRSHFELYEVQMKLRPRFPSSCSCCSNGAKLKHSFQKKNEMKTLSQFDDRHLRVLLEAGKSSRALSGAWWKKSSTKQLESTTSEFFEFKVCNNWGLYSIHI